MTELTKIEQPADYQSSLMEVIARAASDPAVDIDKMERLILMQERIMTRQAKVDFDTAFATMQPELPVITAGNEIKHGEKVIAKYATWDAISRAITPILAKHGFALNFRNSNTDKAITVTAVLKRGGHQEENSVTLPSDTGGAKNAVQAIGSSTTYGQRYAACPLVGITISGDDDGNAAGGNFPIGLDQYDTLKKRISDLQVNESAFLGVLKVDDLRNLPATKFDAAMRQLDRKERPNG